MKEMQATLPQTFYIKPGKFIWSYLGTFLFMLGGCIENSWLSAWLNTQGFDQAHIGQILPDMGLWSRSPPGYPASVWTFLVLKR